MVKRVLLAAIFLFGASQSASAFTLSGFDSPDSVIVDPDTGAYYVSNIAGDPTDRDGNGYISKITPNGNILIQKYIGGKTGQPVLDAPKGLWLSGKRLYVADIDKIKIFDKESLRLVQLVDFSAYGAVNLNDMAFDAAGTIYISDKEKQRIYKLDPKKNYEIKIFLEDRMLGEPNGLAVNPRTRNLMIVSYQSGKIMEADANGRLHILKRGLIGLSGIDYDIEGNLYVASYDNGEIYKIPFYGRGTLSTYLSGLSGPTDIACDRKKQELLVSSGKDHSVTAHAKVKNIIKQPIAMPALDQSAQLVIKGKALTG